MQPIKDENPIGTMAAVTNISGVVGSPSLKRVLGPQTRAGGIARFLHPDPATRAYGRPGGFLRGFHKSRLPSLARTAVTG